VAAVFTFFVAFFCLDVWAVEALIQKTANANVSMIRIFFMVV